MSEIEQKRKTEEAKSAVAEWKHRTKDAREKHKSEVNALRRTMLHMLEERDHFAEIDGYKLTLTRFRFTSEQADQKTKLRIRVTNTDTSESVVIFDVSEQGKIEILSSIEIPDVVADRVREEWKSIADTGRVTNDSYSDIQ